MHRSCPAGCPTPLGQLVSKQPFKRAHSPWKQACPTQGPHNGLGLLQLSPSDCKNTSGAAPALEKTKTMQLPASLHPHRVEAALPLTGLGLTYKNLGME